MTNFEHKKTCQGYVEFFENLTRENVDDLDLLATENMCFEDPFNNLNSRADVKRMFADMFDHMTEPVFKVSSVSWNENSDIAVLKWRFTGHAGRLGPIDFEGMSEVCFNAEGLIKSHIDYWDAATYFYERIPVIGNLIRLIKRFMRLS